jgi:hypothetical protein
MYSKEAITVVDSLQKIQLSKYEAIKLLYLKDEPFRPCNSGVRLVIVGDIVALVLLDEVPRRRAQLLWASRLVDSNIGALNARTHTWPTGMPAATSDLANLAAIAGFLRDGNLRRTHRDSWGTQIWSK